MKVVVDRGKTQEKFGRSVPERDHPVRVPVRSIGDGHAERARESKIGQLHNARPGHQDIRGFHIPVHYFVAEGSNSQINIPYLMNLADSDVSVLKNHSQHPKTRKGTCECRRAPSAAASLSSSARTTQIESVSGKLVVLSKFVKGLISKNLETRKTNLQVKLDFRVFLLVKTRL